MCRSSRSRFRISSKKVDLIKRIRKGLSYGRSFFVGSYEDMLAHTPPLACLAACHLYRFHSAKSGLRSRSQGTCETARRRLWIRSACPRTILHRTPAYNLCRYMASDFYSYKTSHEDMLSKQLESCELGQCPASVEEKTHRSRRNAMHMGTSPERVVDSTFASMSS